MRVEYHSFVLRTDTRMDVVLPEAAAGLIGMDGRDGDAPWPTLYLLHGMSDDHSIWQRRTSIERYATERGLAVVMPCTDLGWYTDMARGPRYFTHIADELPGICRAMFPRMSSRREDTFVAGLSMGGYGALKCGMRRPQTFSKAASLSGAVDAAEIARTGIQDKPPAYWEDVFGPADAIPGSFNDLFAAASDCAGAPDRPELYMWCGTEDDLYGQNLRLRRRLDELGWPVRWESSPGIHSWKYWDEQIQSVIGWLLAGREA